jgi:heme A synthase
LANALAIAHLGFALLFLRAAANPSAERSAIYVALLILGLRAAVGTYHALYSLQGAAALLGLADMTLSVALFVGITNTLAETLRPPADE